MRSGSPPTLWWLLIVADGPLKETDSMTSGYSVPCARNATPGMVLASASNTSMNTRPMVLRFTSGSSTPFRASKNCLRASTTRSRSPNLARKTSATRSASPALSTPLSTKTQVSLSPTARSMMAAATAESTPPERPQMTFSLPSWARIFSTSWPTKFSIVQLGSALQMPNTKLRRTSLPRSLWWTSGWNWMPQRRFLTSAQAAIGELPVCAMIFQPGARLSMRSPWLIHTVEPSTSPAMPAKRSLWSSIVILEAPYSRCVARATLPPARKFRTFIP